MMKILLRKGIFASLLLLLLFGCRQDDFHNTAENNNTQLVSDARSFFQKSNTKIAMLSYVSSYNWDGAIVSNGADGTYVEIPLEVTNKLGTVESSSGETFSAFHRLLMKQKDNGDFEIFYLVLASADKKFRNTDKRFNFYSISQRFSGQIIIIDSQNKKVFARYYDEGFRRPDNPPNNDGTSNQAPDTVTCTYLGWAYEDGTFEPIMLMYCTGNEGDTGTPNYGNTGSGGGGTPGTKTPCEKQQKLMESSVMKTSITKLKTNATSGTGEQGFKAKKDGTPSSIIQGGVHSVDFGDKTGYAGGYHNHTQSGIPMLSPGDIDQLLGFARAQGNYGDPTQAFVGMVAPNGMHYVIRFEGTYQNATSFNFMQQDIDGYVDKMRMREYLYKPTTNDGYEKLFFKTLTDMGLADKVILQRVENDGTVKTINKNNDGTVMAVPCS